MDQHSPGPWQFVQAPERGDGDAAIDGWIHPEGPIVDDEPCVASVNGVGRVDLALILAAPDLLTAAVAARDWFDRFGEHAPIVFGGEAAMWEALDAAIQKALDHEHRVRVPGLRMEPMRQREAAATALKLRLLERVRDERKDDGTGWIRVPCPHAGCPAVLPVYVFGDGSLDLHHICRRGHWTRAHRECVEIVVREYVGWYRHQAAEEVPF